MSIPDPPLAPLDRRTQLAIAGVIVAFAIGWFWAMGGFNVFNPFNIDWMLVGDWQGYLWCSGFTRNGPWALPLGQAPDLMYPYGSSSAYADCTPIAVFGLKLLSPFLPLRAQPYGIWLLGCVITIGLVGARLLSVWVRDAVTLTLGGMFFVASPLIAWRFGHPQFFAQFPYLALTGLGLMPVHDLRRARRMAVAALCFGSFACSINAYMALMGMALTFAVMIRLTLARTGMSPKEKLLWIAASPVATVSVFALFGYMTGLDKPLGQMTAEGFGQFSADLGALWNPMNWGRLLPNWPASGRQGEGFAYLGAGGLLLLAISLVTFIVRLAKGWRPQRSTIIERLPVVVAVLCCLFYATSSIITFHGKQLANLSEFYAHLGVLTSVFRASGRFIWPLHALLTLTSVLTVVWITKNDWVRRVVLAVALLIQAYDINLTKSGFHGPFQAFQPLPSAIWNDAPNGYKHIVIHPIMAQWTCPYDEVVVGKVSWEAYRHHMSINSGLVGRNPPEVKASCMKHLSEAQLDPQSIYVVYFKEFLQDFVGHGYSCGVIDNLVVCVTSSTDTPMRRYLEQHPLPPGLGQ